MTASMTRGGSGLVMAAGALALGLAGLSRAQPGKELRWEGIRAQISLQRTKVPGGWLVAIEQPPTRPGGVPFYTALTFYPDPEHVWDGGSLPP